MRFARLCPEAICGRETALFLYTDGVTGASGAVRWDDGRMQKSDYSDNEEMFTKKEFPAVRTELDKVIGFVSPFAESVCGDPGTLMKIELCTEEAFVNTADYAYPDGGGAVEIAVAADENAVVIRLTDSGVPFDPLAVAEPDVAAAAESRQIGGLGIFMIRKQMDEVFYRYADGKNILTMKKKIGM